MNVTVIKKSESVIYNGKIYGFGQSFEASDLIAKSLIERGYVSQGEVEEEAPLQTGELTKEQLEEMNYQELKRLASQKGLSANGRKDELIARICDNENGTEDEVEEEASYGDLPKTEMPE